MDWLVWEGLAGDVICYMTEEGKHAFLEKRQPDFPQFPRLL